MAEKQNIMATAEPWDLVSEGYAETTMQMLAEYAEEALACLTLHENTAFLDVACGPGTVSLMVADKVKSVHAIDFSTAMLDVFQKKISDSKLKNIYPHHGDAQNLPYENEHFDAAISMFGLMFFPDRAAGLAEIYRTLKSGGCMVMSSWAPVADSPAMQVMFGALRMINPDLPEPKTAVESLENPEVLKQELLDAGFRDVSIRSVIKHFPVDKIPAFWEGMVKGSAPIMLMKHRMGDVLWQEKEQLALAYLHEMLPTVPTTLASNAWLGMGTK